MTPQDFETLKVFLVGLFFGAAIIAMFPRRLYVTPDRRLYRDLRLDGLDVEYMETTEFVETLRDEYGRRHGEPHPDRAKYGRPAVRTREERRRVRGT